MIQNETVDAAFHAAAAAFGKLKDERERYRCISSYQSQNLTGRNLFLINRDSGLIHPPSRIGEFFHGQCTWSKISPG